MPNSSETGRPTAWRWWVCGLLLLATTLNYMDRVALNQTATEIKLALRLTNVDYSRLESGFQLAFAVGAISFGVVVDRFGLRWTYPLAVVGWSAFGFLTGFAPEYWALFACRVGLGVCEAGNWPCGVRTVRTVMPPAERSFGSAIFQSGTGLGAMVTPFIVLGCVAWADPDAANRVAHWAVGGGTAVAATGEPPAAWQTPFRVIGVIGLAWVALWVLTVPKRALTPFDPPAAETISAEPFSQVFFDRRFWILVVLVIGVNTTWHTFRVWLPLFQREQLGYSSGAMAKLTFTYYAIADVGSWTAGLVVLGLTKLGVRLHTSRMLMFGVGVLFVEVAAIMPWYRDLGDHFTLMVTYLTAFGALGLFAAYFALSQELSGKHQGKVTGTLGAINSVYLAAIYEVQGRATDAFGGYDRVLALAGIPALVAFLVVLAFWPRRQSHSP